MLEGVANNRCGKLQIIINSENLLLCTLLKDLLEVNLNCPCLRQASQPFFILPRESEDTPTLFMFDCFGYASEPLLHLMQAELTGLNDRHSVSMFNLPPTARTENQALKLGIRGFFYENDSIKTLIKGIRRILDNEIWLPRKKLLECITANEGAPSLPTQNRERLPADLTLREAEIISILGTGRTNADIADRLCLSPHTVRTHIYNIFRKIGVSNRCQAGRWAAENLNTLPPADT